MPKLVFQSILCIRDYFGFSRELDRRHDFAGSLAKFQPKENGDIQIITKFSNALNGNNEQTRSIV